MSRVARALRALRALLFALLFAAVVIVPWASSAVPSESHLHHLDGSDIAMVKRSVNSTEYDACHELSKLAKKASGSQVFFPLSLTYATGKDHYMTSSSQSSTCVYQPTTAEDLELAIKLVGDKRIRFAVSSGGHASNPGFSSTPGIHITLRGFDNVTPSADKRSVDIGGGLRWIEVYEKLDSAGINVVGGRVPGPGVGGIVTGGGGYSWKTNQYGLAVDTLIKVDMVLPSGKLATASASENPDLFWAIKGGGNQFGVVYNFRFEAYPQSPTVYGGFRMYSQEHVPALINATFDFSENNKDPKAQVITTINSLEIIGGGAILMAIYDGVPGDTNPFAAFDSVGKVPLLGDLKTQSFAEAVRSIPSNLQAGHRGAFHSVTFQRYSKAVMDEVGKEAIKYGAQQSSHSGVLVSYDIEPFLSFKDKAKDAAWPHDNDALPLNLYFAWENPAEDDFWLKAIKESAAHLEQLARDEGQQIDQLWKYPNYAMRDTAAETMFGPNLDRLRQLKQRYDPSDVMRLTGYFSGF